MMRKNKLYTVNPWNRNIFKLGGDSWNTGSSYNPFPVGSFMHAKQQFYNAVQNSNNLWNGVKSNPLHGYNSGNTGGINFTTNYNDQNQRFNAILESANQGIGGWKTAGLNGSSSGGGGGTSGGLSSGAKSAIASGITTAGSLLGGLVKNGDHRDGFGNTMNTAGKALSTIGASTGNIWLAAAGTALDLGSEVLFSYGIGNEKGVRDNTSRLNNVNFNATSMAGLAAQAAQTPLYKESLGRVKDGSFTTKGTETAMRLKREQDDAFDFATNSFANARNNILKNQLANDLYNYYNEPYNISAYGGPLNVLAMGGNKRKYRTTTKDKSGTTTEVYIPGGYIAETITNEGDTVYRRPSDSWWNPFARDVAKRTKNGVASPDYRKLQREYRDAYDGSVESGNVGLSRAKDFFNNLFRTSFDYGGPLGFSPGAVGLMQQNQYIDAINNRSNVIAKANTMQAPTFSFNKFDDGGFVDGFMQDPIAAAMNYIRQKDAEEAQAEAQAAQEAREAEFNAMQTRLMNAETQNQGLQALLEDQGRSIASLQEAQALQAASTPETANWQESMMEAAREVVRNNGGAGSLRDYIKKSEKFSPTAYQLEGEAHPTIGYGFYNVYPGTNRKVKKGDVLSQAEADRYLDIAIQERADNLAKKVPNWNKLTSNQQDALIDLAFNAGDNARHFRKGSKLMTALANEDWEEASKQLATTSRNPNFKRGMQNRSNRRRNMFVNGDYSIKAFGGELGTNGTDFTNGLLQVNAGNTHERNPFGGVPLGVDSQGVPNLVEEGETVFNDYVFSKRLKVPNFMLKDLGLSGAMQKGKRHRMSFADVSKKLAEESEMRPNDPISMNGLNASLSKLMEIQEAERMKQQAKMQNEEMEMMPEMGLMAACGGKLNRYDYGGALNYLKGENVGNKQQIAKAMDAYINRYMKGSKAKDDVKYRDAYNAVIRGSGNLRTPGSTSGWDASSIRDEGTSRKHYQELLDLGMDKRVAFGLAFPQVQKSPDPYSPSGYNIQAFNSATSKRNALYNELVRGNKASASQSRASAPSNSTTSRGSQSSRPATSAANNQAPRAQAAPTSSSTPSTAASNTGSARTAARRNAAPATNRAAQNTTQGNIPPQTDFGAYRQNRANNPFDDVATQNQTIADAKWMADQLGMPLEVEGAAPGVNTNPTNRNWNLGNYDWLSGEFNPSNTAGFIPYNRNMSAEDIAREEGSDRYKAWTDYVLSNWDNQDVQSYLRELDTRAGGNHLFDANGNLREDARDYFQYARGVGDGSNHAWGYYHLTPTWAEEAAANGARPITEADYILTEDELNAAGNRIDEQSRNWTGSGNPVADAANAAAGQRTTVQGPPTYKTWMRYAPAVGAGIFALTDALGITNKPDYTYADKLEAAANKAGYAPNIQAPYIGDYMRYTPFDRLFYANQLQANARATDRALMNNSGANRGTAAAGLLANAYNTNNNLGNLYRQGDEYNRAQYERTKEFNRRTNMFNAQMGLEADMANARYRQQASQMGLSGLAQAANMREAIDARTGATRSANLSNLFTSLGNIGRENMAFNMINSTNAARNGYWIDNKGVVHYVGRGDGLV